MKEFLFRGECADLYLRCYSKEADGGVDFVLLDKKGNGICPRVLIPSSLINPNSELDTLIKKISLLEKQKFLVKAL